MTKLTWAVRVTFREGTSVFERRGGRRGPILAFSTKEAAEAHAAAVNAVLEPGDVATVIQRSHGRQEQR